MLGQWAEVGVWRALDPTVKILAGDTMTFKQEQQKKGQLCVWGNFPCPPSGDRRSETGGTCRNVRLASRQRCRAIFIPGEGCSDRGQI